MALSSATTSATTETPTPDASPAPGASPTSGEAPASTPGTVKYDPSLPADLGVRTLPLLSDAAKAAWAKDPQQALTDAGTKLFGSAQAWQNYLQAIQSIVDSWTNDFENGMRPSLDTSFDWGQVGTLASQAVASAREADVLDIVGLAELAASTDDQDSIWGPTYSPVFNHSLIAASLVVQDNSRFHSCDSTLSLANAYNLVSNSETGWGVDPQPSYEAAVTACGSDPTAAVAYERWKLSNADPNYMAANTFMTRGTFTQTLASGWQSIVDDLQAFRDSYDNNAAAQLVVGDTYRWLSLRVTAETGTGPFTAAEFNSRAIAAYQTAMSLTSMPNVAASLARTLVSASRPGDAASLLAQLPNDHATQDTLGTQAVTAAYQHNYARASQLAIQAQNYTDSVTPALNPIIYATETMTNEPGSLYGDLYLSPPLGVGDASTVDDFGFTPAYRALCATGTCFDLVSAAFLADDTNTLAQQCVPDQYGDYQSGLCSEFADNVTVDNAATRASAAEIDDIQDAYRQYGDLNGALKVLQTYTTTNPNVSLAWERLGEVYFLLGQWQQCADASAHATYTLSGDNDSSGDNSENGWSATGPGWALLRKAASERETKDYTHAKADLGEVMQTQLSFEPDTSDVLLNPPYSNLMSAYVSQEQGQLAFAQNDYQGALDSMTTSVSARVAADNDVQQATVLNIAVSSVRGAQEQIASLAACQLGQYDLCLSWAQKAVEADPFSPLYAETLADAQRAAGQSVATPSPAANDTPSPGATPSTDGGTTPTGNTDDAKQQAINAYQQALNLDPTLFSSWNNMGVLLAQTGQDDAAIDAFKHAVTARPNYPTGWFNLGVAWEEQGGFINFLRSQGALGQAGRLDSSLKEENPVLRFDDIVYSSGIDVSKTIPPDWQLAQTVRTRPSLITIGLFILLALHVIWEVARERLFHRAAETGIHRVQHIEKQNGLARFAAWRPHWAITTVITFAGVLYVAGLAGPWEIAFGAVICAAMLAGHALASRVFALRQATETDGSQTVRHTSFLPASLVTIVAAPFGLGFAPPAPLAESDQEMPVLIRRIGVIVVGLAGIMYALGALLTGVPLANASAMMALILVISALVPIHPLDGSRLGLPKWADWVLTACMIGMTALFALRVL